MRGAPHALSWQPLRAPLARTVIGVCRKPSPALRFSTIRLTPEGILPLALPPNTRDVPRRRASSSRPPRNSGAKRTRTCRNFAEFKKESPRAAERPYCPLTTTLVTQRHSYAVRCAYCDGRSQDIFFPCVLCRTLSVLCVFLSGERRRRSSRPLSSL